jgi:hypothetical protein
VTSTSTETDTIYTAEVATVFATSTTTTTSSGTTTVPTSADFTPLSAELASSSYTVGTVSSMKRRSLQERRVVPTVEEDAELVARAAKAFPTPPCLKGGPTKYPAAVTCEGLVEIISTLTATLTAKTMETVTTSAATTTTVRA